MSAERELDQLQKDVETLHERTQETKRELSTHEAVCAERYEKMMENFELIHPGRLPVVMPEYWELMGMKMDQIVRIGTRDKYGKEKTIKEYK